MKLFKNIIAFAMLAQLAYAQTPFDLGGIKSYYPVVEISTNRVDTKYKDILLDMIKETSKEIGINTENFSSRSLAFLVSYISVDDMLALKLELLLGETMMRLDTKDKVFVISYMSGRIFVPEDEDDLIDNAQSMLENFANQYKEDNL
jgi:hypothetical protein